MQKEHFQEAGLTSGDKQHKGPFTYLVTHLPSGKKYYGVRYAEGCCTEQLWKTYFTSSKEVKKLIKKDGLSAFNVEIRKIFNTVEKAIEWEGRVLKRINARKNQDFINQHNNDSLIGLKGDNNPMRNPVHLQTWKISAKGNKLGKKLTDKHKKAISFSLTGRKRSESECISISKGLKGIKRNDVFKQKCKERQTGIVPSETNRLKKSIAIKGRKKYTDGTRVITRFSWDVPEGFVAVKNI